MSRRSSQSDTVCVRGCQGDSTHLLRAMIAAELPAGSACFSTIYDPEVATQAHAAGVGATMEVQLGGKLDPDMHGEPIVGTAKVRTLTDGEFKLVGPMNTNGMVRLGLTCRLEISGVDVVVASERVQTLDVGSFALHGIDVSAYKLVGLKSSTHFRAGMGPHASQIITADEPGLASGRLEVFESMRQYAPQVAHWPVAADAEYEVESVESVAPCAGGREPRARDYNTRAKDNARSERRASDCDTLSISYIWRT